MANYVVTATMQDGISDPANAAAAAMQAAADAADNLTASVTRVGPSATALATRFDPLTKATSAYNAAVSALTNGQATLAAALTNGTITQAQYSAALAGLQAKVASTRDAMANAAPSAGALSTSMTAAANAANAATVAHTSMYREVVVLADEMLRGNYARIPGSMLELAAYSGQLDTIWGGLKTTAAALVSPIGLLSIGAVAAGAALVAMGIAAESQQRQLLGLQDALMATRSDYADMAAEAQAAAKAVAGQSGFSGTDTLAASQTIAAVPTFNGSTQQLESLITLSGDLATVWQQTLPQAAKTLAAAMQDPGAAAEKLAQEDFPGMTQALADAIKNLADGGDKADAFGQVLNVLQAQVGGAAKNLTPLQSALADLSKAFHTTGADGKTFGQSIGDSIEQAAATAVDAIAKIVAAINNAKNNFQNGTMAGAPENVLNPPTYTGAQQPTLGAPVTHMVHGQMVTEQAVGLMQVLPSTGQQFGYSTQQLASTTGNIQAAIAVLLQYYLQSGGDINAALAMYGGYGKDTNAASGYIKSVQAANPSQLDPNVLQQIQTLAANQNLPAVLGTTLEQLASVESGGHQFQATPANSPANSSLPLPPPLPDEGTAGTVSAATGGVTNTPDSIVNQALAAADKAGTSAVSSNAAWTEIQLYQNALAQLAAEGDTSSQSVVELQQALQKAQVAFANAQPALDKLTVSLDMQIAGNQQVAAAWSQGAAAADHATNVVKAQQQVIQAGILPSMAQYGDAVAVVAAKLDQLTASQQAVQAAQEIGNQSQQLQYLQAEQATLGETADQRATDLAVLKEQQDIESRLPGIESGQKQALLDNAAAIAQGTSQLQQQQQVLSDLSSAFTSAFDTIGNSIAQAFVQGQGAAVNWANVMDSVIEQVIQEFLKLAILNPILNTLFGQNNTTLGSALSVLGAVGGSSSTASGGGGGGSGLLSYVSDLGTLGSIGNALGLTGSNGLLSSFGLGGTGNILSSLGLGNLGSDITGILNTGLIGGFSTADVAAADIGNPLALEAAQEAALAGGQAAGASATIGTALSGVGLGYGAGTLAGGLIQGALNKTGPAPEIGAGGGALAGAAIGSVIPGIGTVIGGLIGGLVGGAGGGLIGPHPASAYSSTGISLQNGQIVVGNSLQQIDQSSGPQTQSDAASLNATLQQLGVQIASLGQIWQIGQNTPGGYQDPTKADSLADAIPNFRFSSSDPTLNNLIAGQSFGSEQDLINVVQQYQAAQAAITTFLSTTAPQLENVATTGGSLSASLDQINTQFNAAISTAQTYAASQDASTAQVQQLTAAEAALTTTRDQQVNATIDAERAANTQQVAGYNADYDTALANVTGSAADSLTAQLAEFDVSAQQQTAALTQQYQGIFGSAYQSSAEYVAASAALEKSLGEQRLAIQQQYNDKLAQTAEQSVSSLGSFLQSLEYGSSSPLSANDQYSLASQQFQTDAQAAAGGDFNAFNALQSDAQTFLSTSATVNGSGAQYQSDLETVINAISAVVNQGSDALTASVLQSTTMTQTQQLQNSLDVINNTLLTIKAALNQNAAMPARLAA